MPALSEHWSSLKELSLYMSQLLFWLENRPRELLSTEEKCRLVVREVTVEPVIFGDGWQGIPSGENGRNKNLKAKILPACTENREQLTLTDTLGLFLVIYRKIKIYILTSCMVFL